MTETRFSKGARVLAVVLCSIMCLLTVMAVVADGGRQAQLVGRTAEMPDGTTVRILYLSRGQAALEFDRADGSRDVTSMPLAEAECATRSGFAPQAAASQSE